MDEELKMGAQRLLDECAAYFKLMQRRGLAGGTIWLTGTGGEMVVYTRGEYRSQLLHNIETTFDANRVYSFGMTDGAH